uniref:Uncharacterized protein n=1 Tax=Escherichia coli TaxID=562 RepID=A0A075MAW6_ECOLX|nr:hypothetical protein [Escherichia coli]
MLNVSFRSTERQTPFIGNACHQSHEAALAVVVGLLAHCLTLDG